MSDSSHQGIGGLSGALLGVSVIAIAFRFVARYQQKAAPLADDYLTIPSLVCCRLHDGSFSFAIA